MQQTLHDRKEPTKIVDCFSSATLSAEMIRSDMEQSEPSAWKVRELAELARHLEEGKAQIEKQRERIASLKQRGYETSSAEQLLTHMETAQQRREQRREQLLNQGPQPPPT